MKLNSIVVLKLVFLYRKTEAMKKEIEELKENFYENLYQLKEIKDWEKIDNRHKVREDGIIDIGRIEPDDLKGVCNKCNDCNLMTGFSLSEDLFQLFRLNQSLDFEDFQNWHEEPIMFLLENPGKDHYMIKKGGNHENKDLQQIFDAYGKTISFARRNNWFDQFKKFSNNLDQFPTDKKHIYAFAFAHLIKKYRLKNVLITNSIKCKPTDKERFSNNEDNLRCMQEYLKIEIDKFKPRVIFAFGAEAKKNLQMLLKENPLYCIKIVRMTHPGYINFSPKRNGERIKKNWYYNIEKYLNDK